MKKMVKVFLLLIFSFSGAILWTACSNDEVLGIDQYNLPSPTHAPTITRGEYKVVGEDGVSYTPGYANGYLRPNRIILNWESTSNSSFLCYKIYKNGGLVPVEIIEDKNLSSFVDSTVFMNNGYFYKVATILNSGNSKTDSITVRTPKFIAPSSFDYDINFDGDKFTLYLENDAESANKYQVEITQGGTTTNDVITGFNVGDLIVSKTFDVIQGENYGFEFIATSPYDTTGRSSYNSPVMNYDNITAVNLSADQPDGMFYIELTWTDDNHSEDGYTIYRKTSTQSEYSEIASLAKNLFIYNDEYSNFEDGMTYNYKIDVYNAEANETVSTIESITFHTGTKETSVLTKEGK